jgi:hypothetical protein
MKGQQQFLYAWGFPQDRVEEEVKKMEMLGVDGVIRPM